MKLHKIVIGIILLAALASAAYGETTNKRHVQPAVEPSDIPHYVCPKTKYIDCMPPVREEKREVCSQEYRKWAESNCPGIRFVY